MRKGKKGIEGSNLPRNTGRGWDRYESGKVRASEEGSLPVKSKRVEGKFLAQLLTMSVREEGEGLRKKRGDFGDPKPMHWGGIA